MISDLNIARTINMEVHNLPKSKPYELMVRKLQVQLERTHDDDDRVRIEKDILYLLALRQVTISLDRIASSLEKLTSGDT